MSEAVFWWLLVVESSYSGASLAIYILLGCARGAFQVFQGIEEVIVGLPNCDAVW